MRVDNETEVSETVVVNPERDERGERRVECDK